MAYEPHTGPRTDADPARISAMVLAGLAVLLWVVVKMGLRAFELVLILLDRVEPAENIFAGEQRLVTRLFFISIGLALTIVAVPWIRDRLRR